MATNYTNQFCVQCKTLVYKGDGFRLMHESSWRTFCAPCASARQKNKNKAVSKAAYIKRQPTLVDQKEMKMTQTSVFKPMTDKQIKYIRDLFKAVKQFMTIDEQESLINKMKGHLDGTSPLSTTWAMAAIKKLKSYNTERNS